MFLYYLDALRDSKAVPCAFAVLQKTLVSSNMSVHISACISTAPTGRISVKFETGDFMNICPENTSLVTVRQF